MTTILLRDGDREVTVEIDRAFATFGDEPVHQVHITTSDLKSFYLRSDEAWALGLALIEASVETERRERAMLAEQEGLSEVQPITEEERAYCAGIWGAEGFKYCVAGASWHSVENKCALGEHRVPEPAVEAERLSEEVSDV